MSVRYDHEWDAGAMGCGELVLELAMKLKKYNSGDVLKLTALDPGAVEDIPAWCRMTGHALVEAQHPNYYIRRRQS